MTGGSHLSVKGRGGERGWAVPVRCAPGGPWVATGIGPKGSPEVHFYFFDFFSPFLFLDFRFVSKSFAKCFNLNQPNA
jgi:hypothetical protein